MYELFANLTLILHLIFILFVIFGGLSFLFFKNHIYSPPALLWGIYIELTNSVCPLTYLENWFLYKGDLSTYSMILLITIFFNHLSRGLNC